MILDQTLRPPQAIKVAGSDDFRRLVDTLPVRVAVIDAEQRFLYVNQSFAAATDEAAMLVVGRPVVEVLGESGAASLDRHAGRVLCGETVIVDEWVVLRSGEPRFLHRVLAPYPDSDSPCCDAFSLFEEDRTDHQVTADIQTSEAVKTAALNRTREAVVTIDDLGVIVYFNPAATRIFGYPREDALGRSLAELIVPPEMRQAHAQALKHRLRGRQARVLDTLIETEGVHADGRRVPLELLVTEVQVGDRHLFTAIMHDISERRDCESQRNTLVHHDLVTGLPNRAWLLRMLGDGLVRRSPMVLVNIHIHRFSTLRNSFGHAFADELLIGLAGRLTAVVAFGDHLVRVGDEVLAMILCGERHAPAMQARLEVIAGILHTVAMPSGASVFLSASLGAAAATNEHETPEDLLRDAEIATSRARENGGPGCVWYDPAMYARVIDQVRTEHDLRRALGQGTGLWVAYQPIVELVSGRLAGFEALMRWDHAERGPIPPVHFIPIAEETGLVVALGRWVLDKACRQLARWQPMRMAGLPDLFMSVNLSPRQLEEPGFIDTVRAAIRDTGIDPQWLKLEITESAVMRKPEESIVVLRELKSLGVRLSIDDFGTGYSSLSYLHKFPVDSIKVDRSFVTAMHLSEENRSIVRIIVDLARLLGFDVIAEGIESNEDANLLQALACDYGQGYYYARPQSPERIEPLLTGRPPWMDGGHAVPAPGTAQEC